MKQFFSEVFKNTLFGVGTAFVTGVSIAVLIGVFEANPYTVGKFVTTSIVSSAFYFLGKEIRSKFFKEKQ